MIWGDKQKYKMLNSIEQMLIERQNKKTQRYITTKICEFHEFLKRLSVIKNLRTRRDLYRILSKEYKEKRFEQYKYHEKDIIDHLVNYKVAKLKDWSQIKGIG